LQQARQRRFADADDAFDGEVHYSELGDIGEKAHNADNARFRLNECLAARSTLHSSITNWLNLPV
jgi:hypothetical protein